MPSLLSTPDYDAPAWMGIPKPAPPEPTTTKAKTRGEQSRINGRKSQGPTTKQGKLKCSRGALKHGLTAKKHAVLDIEDPAELQLKIDAAIDQFRPTTLFLRDLVEQLAHTQWRLDRLKILETAYLNHQINEFADFGKIKSAPTCPELDAFLRGWMNAEGNTNPIDLLHRYMVALEGQYNRALNNILKLEARARTVRRDPEMRPDLQPPYELPAYPEQPQPQEPPAKHSRKPPNQ
jgi:hypothetical protein